VDLYTGRYLGWNVKHFFRFYAREHKGSRSYSWVKNTLQQKADSLRITKPDNLTYH